MGIKIGRTEIVQERKGRWRGHIRNGKLEMKELQKKTKGDMRERGEYIKEFEERIRDLEIY